MQHLVNYTLFEAKLTFFRMEVEGREIKNNPKRFSL